jgi:hypothetical protein
MEKKNRGILEALEYVDRRILYSLMIIVVAVPLIHPLGLPMPVSSFTRTAYNAIEALKPGEYVIWASDVDAGAWAECGPQSIAFLNHLFRIPNIKIIIVSFIPAGTDLVLLALKEVDLHDKKYGIDYVILPYIAGGETAKAIFFSDVYKVVTLDVYGTHLEQMSIMKDFKNVNDISIYTGVVSPMTPLEEYIRQLVLPYKKPLIVGVISVNVPTLMPYIKSGQVTAYLGGAMGAAEYELLIGRPGSGLAQADSISTSHLMILLLVLMGNILYIIKRVRGGKK